MATETKEQTLLRKLARYLREPGNLERKIFHGDALDELNATGSEDREALAAKLDALADRQHAGQRVDRTDTMTCSPRDMWKSDAQRRFENGDDLPPRAA